MTHPEASDVRVSCPHDFLTTGTRARRLTNAGQKLHGRIARSPGFGRGARLAGGAEDALMMTSRSACAMRVLTAAIALSAAIAANAADAVPNPTVTGPVT